MIQPFPTYSQISPWGVEDTKDHYKRLLETKQSTSLTSDVKSLSKSIDVPISSQILNPVKFRSKFRQFIPSCESSPVIGKYKKRNSLGSLTGETQSKVIEQKREKKSISMIKKSKKQIEAIFVYRLKQQHESIRISYGKTKSQSQMGLVKQKKALKLKLKEIEFQNTNLEQQKQKKYKNKNNTVLNLPKIDYTYLFAN